MSSSPKAIVFGPTGDVGSAAAITAHNLGAHVTLAMRDPSKSIPGIDDSPKASTTSSYTRVHADLTDPATVRSAVEHSGAKYAFIYLVPGSPDHMLGTIQALQAGGITLVVFLSSFTVAEPLETVPQQDVIGYLHARVEMNLERVFGRANFVALRPGSFASNEAQLYAAGFAKGHVRITYPWSKVDCIAPKDIGRVGGTILAQGPPEDGNRAIYLYGPQFNSGRQSVATMARVLGREPTVADCGREEARQVLMERGYPPPLAEYFLRQTHREDGRMDEEDELFGHKVNLADVGNVEKYGGGRKATTFEEYVRENEKKFLV